MRKMQTRDLFSLMKILKKMNMKEEIKELTIKANKKGKKDSVENVQADLVMLFIDHLGDAEQEIYKFLGALADKTADEIAEQAPNITFEMIKELFSQENFGSFLTSALK